MEQQPSSYPPSYHISTRQPSSDPYAPPSSMHHYRDGQPVKPRTGSGSGSVSSNHLLSDAERGGGRSGFALPNKEGDYPEGWTKEDEEAEREFMKRGMVDWDELKSWRFWIRREWWYYYIIVAVICVLVVLMSVYHDDIVTWMKPAANWMKNRMGHSYRRIFHHFLSSSLWPRDRRNPPGTLIGEIGNFYAFKYCLRSTAEKYEKNNINYACLAHVVREGGFFIIFVARMSAIPGHFTTAVFATCGMNIWIFTLAAVLSLPKQLIVVYLGVMFDSQEKSTKEKWISHGVLIFGFILTLWSAWYIWRKMQQARLTVWRRRRMEAAAQGLVLDPIALTTTTRPDSLSGGRVGEGGVQSLAYDTDGNGGEGYTHKQWNRVVPMIRRHREGEEDEAQNPILREHSRDERDEREGRVGYGGLGVPGGRGAADAGRYQSYQNPYDVRYQNANEMSVYDVDVDANGPLIHAVDERDITYGYGYRPAASSETLLSQQVPVQPQPQPRHQPPEGQSSTHHLPSYSHSQSQPHTHLQSHSRSAPNSQPQETLVYFPEAHSTGIESTPDGHVAPAGQSGTTVHRSATKATVYAKEEESVSFPRPKPNRI
ncbi:hypothetical protein I308_106470 [Cryptococcus tetragattii IND107]|uniref:Golgi apparatus membrane protein TVP38 n=1 Tax=Cryptococcus tetragattii IND107 TaxID=1296105 RepID=A0ABR3BK66_9TREE